MNVEKFIEGLHGYLKREFKPLIERIQALESRQMIPGPPGEKGERGERGDQGLPGVKGESGPPGSKGEQGLQGEKGERGESGPPGETGQPGPPGKDGKDGIKGDPGPKGEQGAPGERGERGERGEKGDQGKDGAIGPKGEKGEDGKSFTREEAEDLVKMYFGAWQMDFEKRAKDSLQKIIDWIPSPSDGRDGKDGKDGRDGKDGYGFEDISVEIKNDRDFVLKFSRNGDKDDKEFLFKLPILIDRGIYRPSGYYEKGDGVTYAGSFWICQRDNPSKPGEEDSGWRLAVKRGRDSKGET